MLDRFIPVAEVCKPHGVTGELRLRLFNESSALLLARPPLKLRFPDGTERELRLGSVREQPKGLLARFVGIEDRDAAQALGGAQVLVQRKHFPPLEGDEFYACDVEGAKALLQEAVVGEVLGLRSYPTCDALAVRLVDGDRVIEVPLVDAHVERIDVTDKVVHFHSLDGLLD